MKTIASFNVDWDILKNFNDALQKNDLSADEIIEKFMCAYAKPEQGSRPLIGAEIYLELTKMLLTNCKNYPVGKLADVILRKLLEAGAATDKEIEEMQKASGNASVRKYHIFQGFYCRDNFKTAFPLLIAEEKKKLYDLPPQFYATPFNVRGRKFYLCSQWFERNREPIEKWIKFHLPNWFEFATEEQKADMEIFIRNA